MPIKLNKSSNHLSIQIGYFSARLPFHSWRTGKIKMKFIQTGDFWTTVPEITNALQGMILPNRIL